MQKISIPMIGGMHVVAPNPWLIICQCLAVLAATIIVALIVARYAAHHWQGDKKDVATGYAAISGVMRCCCLAALALLPRPSGESCCA